MEHTSHIIENRRLNVCTPLIVSKSLVKSIGLLSVLSCVVAIGDMEITPCFSDPIITCRSPYVQYIGLDIDGL
jgi:hypothetical protein